MTGSKSDVMTELGFALFDTPIDCCGIVWNGRGIAGVQLPETDRRAVRNRILRRFPGACEAVPPADVLRVVDDIAALLTGEPRDLGYAKIDTAALLDFHRRVYDVARTIPAGATLSYGEVAARLAIGCSPARSAKRLGKIRSRSSCLAIACWRPGAKWADFLPAAACAPSCACSRSKARSRAARRCSGCCRFPCGHGGVDLLDAEDRLRSADENRVERALTMACASNKSLVDAAAGLMLKLFT